MGIKAPYPPKAPYETGALMLTFAAWSCEAHDANGRDETKGMPLVV